MVSCANRSMRMLAIIASFSALPALADSGLLIENIEVAKGQESFEGFFLGLDALYSHLSVDRSDFEVGAGNDIKTNAEGNGSHSRCRIDPSLNLGYSRIIDNFYVGISADVSFGSSQKGSFTIKPQGVGELPLKSSVNGMSYGIKAKCGCYCPKMRSVFYGFAGAKWREIDFRIDSENETVSKAKLRSPAFLVGLGVERGLCKKATLSAEYEFAWRNSNNASAIKIEGVDLFAGADQKLRDHTVKIGVKYHF